MGISSRLLVLAAPGLFGLGLTAAGAGPQEHGFLERTYRDADRREARYVLFVPHAYQGEKPYPLIVFLHGSGETGTDGQKPVRVGLGPAIRKQARTFPFLVLFPQGRHESWDANSPDSRRALAILAEVQKAYRVDPQRIYVTGLSSGGDGTWSWAVKYPRRWAAIVPICGVGNPADARTIKDVPCWCFEGGADDPRDLATVHALIKALKAAGAHPRYTEYPGVGHRCWDRAYGTPELYDWLLKQHRK